MVSQPDDDTVVENDADLDEIEADDETIDESVPTDADMSDGDSSETPDITTDSENNGCGCTVVL